MNNRILTNLQKIVGHSMVACAKLSGINTLYHYSFWILHGGTIFRCKQGESK